MSPIRFLRKSAADVRNFFTAEHVSLLPAAKDLRHYSTQRAALDARAALNVTLLGLPQAIAYAAIAGIPVVHGILCAAVAAIVAPLFAGSRHTILGPTNATAFMLFSFFSVTPALAPRSAELLPLLVLMVGIFAVAGSILRIADLLQYVSRSVLVGYLAGAAVLIIANQAKPLLGLAPHIDKESASSFLGLLSAILRSLPQTDWAPLAIGTATFLFHAALRRWKPKWPAFAITLLAASAIFGPLIHRPSGPFSHVETFQTFQFTDLIPSLPSLFRPSIFNDISALLGVAIAIAFLASLENTLMAKTIASRKGDRPDVNQDMFSVGMANLACSAAGAMPASGSLTRTLLNHESGAQGRMASILSGIYTLAAACLIAASVQWGLPLIDFVPKAALAALIISLAASLFNKRHILICLRSTGDDAAVLILTFLAALLAPLHVAIFLGVAFSIILFLRKASHPFLVEYEFNEDGELRERQEKQARPIPAISIVHVEGDLFFGAAELFRSQIQRTIRDPAIRVIILRMKNARHLDATSVMALEDLILFMRSHGLHLLISGATRHVYKVLKRSGVLLTLQQGCNRAEGESNLFLNFPSNPNLSTRDALLRAQQLLGTREADIRIFYDPSRKSPPP